MKQGSQNIISGLKSENKKRGNKDDSLSNYIDSEKAIQEVNLKIIADVENQKLELRDKLIIAIKHIIWFQLISFNVIVFTIVLAVTSSFSCFKNIDIELSIQLFDFLEYYIKATIVELLGMLVFILHYVFSDFRFAKSLKSKIKEKWKLKRQDEEK